MHRLKILMVVLVLTALACGTGSGTNTPESVEGLAEIGPADLGTLDLSLDTLGAFHAVFVLEFEGESDWTYQVDTRSNGELIEYDLHIEGVDEAQNPGDVRLVNNDGVNQMNGAGTDFECVQFPDEFETGVLFLSPNDLIDLEDFSEELEDVGEEKIAGREATEYLGKRNKYAGWRSLKLSVWVDDETGAVLQIDFSARGSDPIFGAGSGKISGKFTVKKIGSQQIQPVEGCEIDIPLPEDAANIIIFPGMIAFETSLGPVRLGRFYKKILSPEGWMWEEPVIAEDRKALLTFYSDEGTLTILIEPISADFSQGYQVQMFIEFNKRFPKINMKKRSR